MRVLHVANHTGRYNGNVHAAIDLACAQAQLGHEVAVCSAGGDFDDILLRNRVAVFHMDRINGPKSALRASWRLRTLLGQWKPDIVHAHMMKSAVAAYGACVLRHRPLVTTVHNAFERTAFLMRLGHRTIAVSEAVAALLIRRRFSAKRLRVVLNGTLGSARRSADPPRAAELAKPALLYVGGLHPRKGVGDLLVAFELVAEANLDAHLYLVGEGPSREAYEAQAAAMACADRIHFCGAHADPRNYLLGADIFILASHFDPAPLVISEAREAGCAVVATRVDGIPEMLEHGEAGILVEPQAPERLADVLRDLVSNAALLREWRLRSQSNIGRLTLTRVAEQTMSVYAECLAEARMGGVLAQSPR